MSTLQDRMGMCLRRNPGVTQADLARATGAKSSSVSAWVNGPTKTLDGRNSATLARLFGCDRDWLAFGLGAPNWADPLPPSAGLSKTPVAQHLSLTPFDTPHEFTWEQLMQAKDLPARFVVPVPDGALAGRYEKGTRIVFEVGAAPKPGRPILVEDGAGARYVRLYGGVRGDRWQAIATDLAYATLDAEADQLQLLAAALWIEA